MVKLEDIIDAYYDCRKHKRGTENALMFELDYQINCVSLYNDINNRTYKPTTSIAFIVTKPRRREIFAADFRDRILHHYVDAKIRPLLELEFIEKTCNNRKGKGTSKCVEYLRNDIIEVSENYTSNCYVAKMDISGFFMSISKSLLTTNIIKFVEEKYTGPDKEDIIWLLKVLINDNPESHCVLKSPWSEWLKIDKNKSLFFGDKDKGLPIGNLISQLLANFYLNDLDHYITEELGFTHYGRYVDDFYIVYKSKEEILNAIPLIREKLKEVGLQLHKKKFYIQHYSKGIEFVGTVIKPGRTYVHGRTVNNAFRAIEKLNKEYKPGTEENAVAVINSYLGFMKNHKTYAIRRKLLDTISPKLMQKLYISGHHEKVVLKEDYKRLSIIKLKLSNNGNKKLNQSKVRRDKCA